MSDRLNRVALGVQSFLTITKAPGAAGALIGQPLIGQLLNVAGVYECMIDVTGLVDIDVFLMPSAVVGTITPSLVTLRNNNFAEKTVSTPAGAQFAAATGQTLSFTGLKGVRWARLRFTLDGGESIAFIPGADPEAPAALAEYNGA